MLRILKILTIITVLSRVAIANPQAYYKFSQDGKECIITRHDTPVPWLNFLNNDTFQAWITNTGHFECVMLDKIINGLTNPEDGSGYLYLRDRQTGEYFMINKPAKNAKWQCRHGLGYTKIETSNLDLSVSVTYFIPRNDNALVWLINIRNDSSSKRQIDLFSTVEWNLGDRYKRMLFYDHGGGNGWPSQFNLAKKIDFEDEIIYASTSIWQTFGADQKSWPYTGFYATSLPIKSLETQKSTFLGNRGSFDNPKVLEKGDCSGEVVWGTNEFPLTVLQNSVTIAPDDEVKLTIAVGMVREKTKAPAIAKKYSDVQTAEKELAKVKKFWNDFIANTINVQTPEKDIDRIVNIWSKYQWRTSIMKSLNTSLRSRGLWSYGIISGSANGHEVLTQPHDMQIVKEAVKTFLTGQGEPLMLYSDLGRKPPKNSHPSTFLHGGMSVTFFKSYIEETGDLSILDTPIVLVDGTETTIFEQIVSGVEANINKIGSRGLSLLPVGLGDWNDELNMVSKYGFGESVMLSMDACYMLKECAELAKIYDREDKAKEWLEKYEYIKIAINKHAWDGQWYVRAFAEDRNTRELTPIGSSGNKYGKIYLNPQSWAVISGVANEDRAKKCLDSVEKYLLTDVGPIINTPCYINLDDNVGSLSKYSPGWRQGNNFLRCTGWAVMAACKANRADLAFAMYKKSSLSHVSKNIERFKLEPYAYPENYVGPEHKFYGRGQYQWNVGQANWMWRTYVHYILGIRPTFEGLLIDPKIPSHWAGYKVTRPFRGATYEIDVTNPDNLSMGIKSLVVDGIRMKGQLIPAFSDGKTHRVQVALGK